MTVSIGIPAYNEQANIKNIVFSLLRQEQANFVLKEIIIASDGSDDRTLEKLLEIKSDKIKIIAGMERKGKSYRMSQIFAEFTGDCLFILDADIEIEDNNLLSDIFKKIDLKKQGIMSVEAVPLIAENYFEACINHNVKLQMELRKKWNKGENYMVIRGVFIGLWGEFAKSIILPPELVNNDTYLYFLALEHKYHPKYVPDLNIFYKSPKTLKDHILQSSRFQNSGEELEKYFQIDPKEYKIPKLLVLGIAVKYLIKQPLYFVTYLGIMLITRIKRQKSMLSQWRIALSTKY